MSRVFRSIINARARLYESGWLKTHRLDQPVISVGNLTIGGTGKTPLVITLAGEFRDLGYRPVVLSRGYRRSGRGTMVVSRGNGPMLGWEESGDEPFMIATRLPGVAVVVGKDRYEAGLLAERERLGDLFILDDGFQHRRLAREVNIVTIDPEEWAKGENLLPIGRWREPKSSLARAHAACVQTSDRVPAPELPIPTFGIDTLNEGLFRNQTPVSVDSLPPEPVTAFAGIAKPDDFFEMLEGMGIELAQKKSFPDHYAYRPKDLAGFGEGIRITTEKDAVRLSSGDFYFLRISANILRLKELLELILEKIGSNKT